MIFKSREVGTSYILVYEHLDQYKEYDDDLGYVEPTKSRSIVPSTIAPNMKFDTTSSIIKLSTQMSLFLCVVKYDANM